MIPKNFIEELTSRAEVLAVVSRYVELKKKGINYQGLCPFHSEKKPSFNVSPIRGNYHCFGCGQHGDALKFLQDHLGLSFTDAVRELAAQVGMQVPQEEPSRSDRRQAAPGIQHPPASAAAAIPAAEALARADAHYRGTLRKSDKAIESLKQRGITGETAKTYRLGYAAGPRNLAGAFPQYDAGVLLETGLVTQNDDGSRNDVFVDAITLPVRNHEGTVVGFVAAPVWEADNPSYMLSRASAAFHPDRVPYGLFEARGAIRSSKYAVVTDGGCLSVLALAQFGIGNAVCAAKGPFTAEHLKTLLRFTRRVMFLCESNADGEYLSADVYAELATQLQGDFRVAFLPASASPLSCLRAGRKNEIREQMAKAKSLARQSAATAA